eukprot:5672912-Alexandrium_andersonii.AAC.1
MDAMCLASTASWGTAHLTGGASWSPPLPCRKRGPPARRPAAEKKAHGARWQGSKLNHARSER